MPGVIVREENIENVLEKSLYLFAEHGVGNTTINMIAKETNLTTRSIQNYFANKDELILSVLKYELNKAENLYRMEIEQPYFGELNGLEQIRELIRIAMRYSIEESRFTYGIFCIAYGAGISFSEKWSQQHISFENYAMDCIRNAIKKGIGEGVILEEFNSDEMIRVLMMSLHSMVQEMANKCISFGETKEIKDKLYKLAELYAEKEVAGLGVK